MKLHYKSVKLTQLVLFITANLFLVSCGTYQSVYNDDGIYGDTTPKNEEKKIIVVNEKEYQDYEENYFSKKLVDLQNIDNNEIFTDVDDYYYDDGLNNGEFSDENSSYNGAQPWGYEDNNVVVNVNLMNNPFWGGGFNNWGFNVFAVGGWNNWGWGYNNPWRWRRGFGRPWGFSTWGRTYANWGFIDPYAGIGVWNGGYLHPFLPNFGITGFRNNRYNNINRGVRYGRRNVVANNTRRNNTYTRNRNNTNRRVTTTTGRRNTNTVKRNTTTNRRRIATPTNRRGTTINRRGSSSSRRSSNLSLIHI